MELQDKAKLFLTASPNSSAVDNAIVLYQMIEDFCRETDRFMETEKKGRDDLHLQVRFGMKFNVQIIFCDKFPYFYHQNISLHR